MELRKIGGYDFYVRSSDLEASSNVKFNNNMTIYSTVTFGDGEVLKKVLVDSALAHFEDIGPEGRFVFIKANGFWVLVAMEFDGKLRVTSASGLGSGMGVMNVYGGIALVFALPGLAVMGNGAFIPGLLLAAVPLLFAFVFFKDSGGMGSIKDAGELLRQRGGIDGDKVLKAAVAA